METERPNASSQAQAEFSQDSLVIYGHHGKCKILQVETRKVGDTTLRLYKLEVFKSPLSRSSRGEPAIWVPVKTAAALGMRAPMSREQAEEVRTILSNKESYFSLNENWDIIHPLLETTIREEGSIGLAKAFSYLFVLKRKWVTLPKDVSKYFDLIHKLLFREMADALETLPKTLDEKLAKGLKNKPVLDT